MNRNVSIVVVLLVIVVIVGYLVWLRSKMISSVSPEVEEQVQVTSSPERATVVSPSATPGAKEATDSVKTKTSTSGATRR